MISEKEILNHLNWRTWVSRLLLRIGKWRRAREVACTVEVEVEVNVEVDVEVEGR